LGLNLCVAMCAEHFSAQTVSYNISTLQRSVYNMILNMFAQLDHRR
jgi:hypothetical protein